MSDGLHGGERTVYPDAWLKDCRFFSGVWSFGSEFDFSFISSNNFVHHLKRLGGYPTKLAFWNGSFERSLDIITCVHIVGLTSKGVGAAWGWSSVVSLKYCELSCTLQILQIFGQWWKWCTLSGEGGGQSFKFLFTCIFENFPVLTLKDVLVPSST